MNIVELTDAQQYTKCQRALKSTGAIAFFALLGIVFFGPRAFTGSMPETTLGLGVFTLCAVVVVLSTVLILVNLMWMGSIRQRGYVPPKLSHNDV